jgi:hypothetical protein
MDMIMSHGLTFLLGLGIVSTVVARYASKAKKAVTALKESLDVIDGVIKAAEDNAVTEVEFQGFIKEAKEAKQAWVDLVKKA